MVMTIGKKLDGLESYCDGRTCTGCKMLDGDYNCKLGYIEDAVEALFAIFGLDKLCEEIEKADRSANQSANSIKTPYTNDTTSEDETARAILQVVESASTEELYKHINFILRCIRLKRQEDTAMDSMDPEWLITEFYNDGTGWYFGTTKKEK